MQDWFIDNGVWEIGAPASGSCYEGTQCARTVVDANYPNDTDSRLISAPFALPTITGHERLLLRFWHRFSYSDDSGRVQINPFDPVLGCSAWETVGAAISGSSGGWVPHQGIVLSSFSGQKICLAFYHTANGYYTASGWFIDNISVSRFSNEGPPIDPIPDQEINEGEILTIVANASDPDGDPITLSISNLPSFGSFTDNGNGTGAIMLKPGFEDAGECYGAGIEYCEITVTANDGSTSTSESFKLVVHDVNRPPTLQTSGNHSVEQGHALTYFFRASDPDNDTLSFTAANLPAGAELNDNGNGTGELNWIPAPAQIGDFSITLIVSDDHDPIPPTDEKQVLTDEKTVIITVTEPGSDQGASVVSTDGRQLLVQRRRLDGTLADTAEPYTIRGVVWSPASRNTDTTKQDPNNATVRRPEFRNWFETDIPLLAAMNVNTVRLLIDPGVDTELGPWGKTILDEFYRNGIMVIMNVDDAINDLARIEQVVNFYKDHPAVLMWMLGSEWNINRYFGIADSILDAAQRTEEAAALIKTLDPNHPVATSYGDIDIDADGMRLADTAYYVNDICPSVDIWALNIYRGNTFGNLFNQWASISGKPMFIGEFGTDAFRSENLSECPAGQVDETMQADWDLSLWNHLADNLSANDPSKIALGGTVFEWNDEWWKVSPPGFQEVCGFDFPGAHPDNFANEEYFGIVDIDRQPREAYYALQEAFQQPPYVVDFTTLPNWLETNIETFYVAGNSEPGSFVTVNGVDVTDSSGSFATLIPLSVGDNLVGLVIESPQGNIKTYLKTIHYDPNLSTQSRNLIYVDSTVADLSGTIVIDVDNELVLGILEGLHVVGIAANGKAIYMEDRTVIDTATHQIAPWSPLMFTMDLSTDAFLVSPDGKRLYARDEILTLPDNRLLEERLCTSIETGASYGGFRAGGPAISSDGKTIFARENPTWMINTETNICVSTHIVSGGGSRRFVSDLALTPDDRFLFRSAYNFAAGYVDVFDAATFEPLANLSNFGDFVGEIVFTSNGEHAVTGSAGNPVLGGGRVAVIDIETSIPSFENGSQSGVARADNLAISLEDEIYVSSGNRRGIDVFVFRRAGTLSRTKSFFLNISRTSDRNEIKKVVFKPSSDDAAYPDAIGVYRPVNRRFYLDLNNSLSWDAGDVFSAPFGIANDLPIAGDWNGDGFDQIGVFRPGNRRFYLDLNGNDKWDGSVTDVVTPSFGITDDLPVSGKW